MSKTPRQLQKQADKDAAQRKRMLIKMRQLGRPYEEIAKVLGFADEEEAREFARVSFETRHDESAEQLCKEWMDRAEAAYQALAPSLDPDDKTEWTPGRIAAILGTIKVGERVAKMKGLDAPKRTELSGRDGAPLAVNSVTVDLAKLDDKGLQNLIDGLHASGAKVNDDT